MNALIFGTLTEIPNLSRGASRPMLAHRVAIALEAMYGQAMIEQALAKYARCGGGRGVGPHEYHAPPFKSSQLLFHIP